MSALHGASVQSPCLVKPEHSVGGGRRRLERVGSVDWLESIAHYPEGPGSVEGLFGWADEKIAKLLAHPERAAVFEHNLRTNLKMTSFHTSHFAGKGSLATGLVAVERAAKKRDLIPENHQPFRFMAASDMDEHCIKVLRCLKRDGQRVYRCVFGEFSGRFKASVLEHVEKLKPTEGMTKPQKAAAFAEMHRYLKDECAALGPDGLYEHGRGLAWCFCHEKQCPVNNLDPTFTGSDPLETCSWERMHIHR